MTIIIIAQKLKIKSGMNRRPMLICTQIEDTKMGNPHVLVIPYPAQGHVIPLMKLSESLVNDGFKITFVNTEQNHKLMASALQQNGGSIGDQIRLVLITDGMESAWERSAPGKLSEAILKVMPGKVEELIEEINKMDKNKIACVVADQSLGWALEIAEKKGIHRAAFCPAAAAQLVLGFSIPKLIEDGVIDAEGTPPREQIIQLSPKMPAVGTNNLVWTCVGDSSMQKNIFELMFRNNKTIKLAEWLICNSSYALEPDALALAPQILPIGPLLASNTLKESSEDLSSLKWLDQHPPCSVIYVAFGSFTVFNQSQFQELALGLELCNMPFLWVVRPDAAPNAKLSFPKGFQERVAWRGKMVGFAPQERVLGHPSIACFLSHCGWNSTIEGVSHGIPFLGWPYFADQFLNRSYICDVWKVGIGFDEDGSGIIAREEIRTKVEELMANGQYKERAMALKDVVMAGVKKDGGCYKNFRNFIEWMKSC